MNGFNPYSPTTPYFPTFNTPSSAPSSNVGWVYVNGIEGARNQIVQPNQVSWMMDNNDPRIYVKAVDGMGTVTLKAFALEEISANAPAALQNVPAALPNGSDAFVTKNDLSALEQRIAHIEKEIGGITQ